MNPKTPYAFEYPSSYPAIATSDCFFVKVPPPPSSPQPFSNKDIIKSQRYHPSTVHTPSKHNNCDHSNIYNSLDLINSQQQKQKQHQPQQHQKQQRYPYQNSDSILRQREALSSNQKKVFINYSKNKSKIDRESPSPIYTSSATNPELFIRGCDSPTKTKVNIYNNCNKIIQGTRSTSNRIQEDCCLERPISITDSKKSTNKSSKSSSSNAFSWNTKERQILNQLRKRKPKTKDLRGQNYKFDYHNERSIEQLVPVTPQMQQRNHFIHPEWPSEAVGWARYAHPSTQLCFRFSWI